MSRQPRTPGYTRSRRSRGRHLDALWSFLLRAREPVSLADLAQRSGASKSYVKHVLRAGREAGYVIAVGSATIPNTDGPGAAVATLYMATDDAPDEAPVLTLADGKLGMRAAVQEIAQ